MRIDTSEPSLVSLFEKGQVGLIRTEFMRLNDVIGSLNSELERLTEAWVDKKMQEDRDALLKQAEMLERQVNYWRIEAECDHGRWQRCLEDLEHLRRLK